VLSPEHHHQEGAEKLYWSFTLRKQGAIPHRKSLGGSHRQALNSQCRRWSYQESLCPTQPNNRSGTTRMEVARFCDLQRPEDRIEERESKAGERPMGRRVVCPVNLRPILRNSPFCQKGPQATTERLPGNRTRRPHGQQRQRKQKTEPKGDPGERPMGRRVVCPVNLQLILRNRPFCQNGSQEDATERLPGDRTRRPHGQQRQRKPKRAPKGSPGERPMGRQAVCTVNLRLILRNSPFSSHPNEAELSEGQTNERPIGKRTSRVSNSFNRRPIHRKSPSTRLSTTPVHDLFIGARPTGTRVPMRDPSCTSQSHDQQQQGRAEPRSPPPAAQIPS